MKKDWNNKMLGDICNITIGKTPARKNSAFWDEEKTSNNVWLSIADLSNTADRYVIDSSEYISDEGAALFDYIPKGTLLVSFKLTLGRLAFAGKNLRTNEAIAALRNSQSEVMDEYLYYYLLFFDWDKYASTDHKVKGKTLNKDKVKKIPVSYPELSEQKKIVKYLDDKFATIDQLAEVTKKKITDSKDLFDVISNTSFDSGNEEVQLGNHIDFLSGPAFKSKEYTNQEDGILLLRGDNIVNKSLRWEGVKKWPKDDLSKYDKYLLQDGDVVLAMDRPFVGYGLKHSLISEEDLPLLLVQRVARLRCKSSLNRNFLMYLIASRKFISYLLDGQTGVSVPHISKRQIEDFRFILPSKAEQKQIVKKLDSFALTTSKLERIFEDQLFDLTELKNSYLQEVFSKNH